MQGPTLTMSTALDSGPMFARSRSSPNIADLVNVEYRPSRTRQESEFPRSASFTYISTLNDHYASEKGIQTVVSTSADLPDETTNGNQTLKWRDGKPSNKSTKEERPKLERLGRTKSLVSRPKSWIQRVKGSPERQDASDAARTTQNSTPPVPPISKPTRDNRSKTVSESFATFARKSWISSSRSPSPSRVTAKDTEHDKQRAGESNLTASLLSSPSRSAQSTFRTQRPSPAKLTDSPQKPDLRKTSTFQKIKQRPQSVLMNFTNFTTANSSTSSLPRSSLDNKSTPRTSTDKLPPVPKTLSTERLQNLGIDSSRRRDELWSAFRSLENDYTKFETKSWSLKTNVVRSALLPFLKSHASHPSNKNLRPEDLDRRVMILNKWWAGLLEVLDGRQNQTVSGVDRPILLEACYSIMVRPEWRATPSQYAPLSERSASRSPVRHALPKQKSFGSLNSSASQFMAESVYHNTRNLFIQNLLAQVTFVVDKMSLRHAPASLVTFCGKAVAYAFFFVPGIAEVLVRVWKLQADILRRVADELGLPRLPNRFETDEVASAFPAHMQSLGWTSPKSMVTQLRQSPALSIMAAKINWYGPWVARWCGRDSDLFFVFAKHYHILAEEFMAPELCLEMKARAPGFVLVQAQILTALDATIHRQPPVDPLPITFDDVLSGADASAAALPLPSNNSARPMAENRLIMLLRDFISERPSDFEGARMTFAETFGKMMQASARKTSLYDHNACFVLCDFMEEALAIYVKFHHAHGLHSDFIDWYFWLEVCKKVLQSQNSMSEIRLFAFIYGAWTVITNNEFRKEVMCLDWLLTEETFGKFFSHWCPMVRAYYMRLLCWRLCRDDGGEVSNLDMKIFSTVSIRIKSTWSHYLFLKQSADKSHMFPPSTAPCHPAPGRRLLIIRNDNQAPATNIFLGFDGIIPASNITPGTTQPTAYKRHSSLATLINLDADSSNPKLTSDTSAAVNTKKRWSIMGKMLPSTFSSSDSPSASPTNSRSTSPTKTLEEARRETALARARPPLQPSKPSSSDSETPPSTMAHRAYSFKFSLEWAQHFEKPSNVAQQNGTSNGKGGEGRGGMRGGGGVGFNVGAERRLGPPRLPAAAQACIGARVPGTSNQIFPRNPTEDVDGVAKAERLARAKYSGRALAEWALIVGECNNFVDRRRAEGVPGLKWVEIPTLGVEGFRRFGG